MKLLGIALRNYRNIELARLDFSSDRVFLLGPNGMGKTNLAESIGFVSSLRAFRSHENKYLIGSKGLDTELIYRFEHEYLEETRVRVLLKARGKEVRIDDQKMDRMANFIGKFPTVMFASDDIQLVRGAPGIRRRFLDSFLSSLSPHYLSALQDFHKAVQSRNALLKKGETKGSVLEAFEDQMKQPAFDLHQLRKAALEKQGRSMSEFYGRISEEKEQGSVAYRPSCELESAEDYSKILEKSRHRDTLMKSTQKGPHRDDFQLLVDGQEGSKFGSDGQQRALALAVKFAQFEMLKEELGILPIVIADDVLGELDPRRRQVFWECLDEGAQLFATGTEIPDSVDGRPWQVFEVKDGVFVGK